MTFCFVITCYSVKLFAKPLFVISDTGKNSISVYYIHGFVALLICNNIGFSVLCQFAIAAILTVFLCWLLSRDNIVSVFKPLFDFNITPTIIKDIICRI